MSTRYGYARTKVGDRKRLESFHGGHIDSVVIRVTEDRWGMLAITDEYEVFVGEVSVLRSPSLDRCREVADRVIEQAVAQALQGQS